MPLKEGLRSRKTGKRAFMAVQIIRVTASSRCPTKRSRKKNQCCAMLFQVVMIVNKKVGTQGKLDKLG